MAIQNAAGIDLSDLDVNGLSRGQLASALFDAALAVAQSDPPARPTMTRRPRSPRICRG